MAIIHFHNIVLVKKKFVSISLGIFLCKHFTKEPRSRMADLLQFEVFLQSQRILDVMSRTYPFSHEKGKLVQKKEYLKEGLLGFF